MTTEVKLKEVLERLEELKKSTVSKASLTIIVAMIGSVTSLGTIGINYYVIGPALMTKSRAEERVALRKEGLEQLRKVKSTFEKVCKTGLSDFNKNALVAALEEFQQFNDKLEAYYPLQSVIYSLSQYNDYVALKYHEINSTEIDNENATEFFTQSSGLYETARNAIDGIIKS